MSSLRIASSIWAVCALGAPLFATPQLPLDQVDLLLFAPVNVNALVKEDVERELAGQPWRFAVPHDVSISPATRGTWESAPDGSILWRLRIGAAQARSINLGFTEFALPEGASLVVRASDDRTRIRAFTHLDNEGHGQLWTPVVFSEEVVVELRLPRAALHDLRLVLGRVGQGYRGFGYKHAGPQYASGSCNVDVVCAEGDPWALEIPSVGALQINGFLNCTGVLLNDSQDSLTPYFLTADHCGVSETSAASLVVYWNYQNSFCRAPGSSQSGQGGDGTLNQFTTGSVHRADHAPSDFTLVELDDDPDPAFAVSYAGWDRGPAAPPAAIAIHHPGVEEKRISFENDATSITSYLADAVPGDGSHLKITDWDLGTTEGGSSGSPLFDPQHRVVGQLHGGFASCSSQTADWYGRIHVSWEGGGTADSRLRDWLDPIGSGVLQTDTISLDTLCSDAGTVEFLTPSVACNGIAEVRVVDCGLNTNPTLSEGITLLVTSASDPVGELISLSETSPNSARFEGTLQLGAFPGIGILAVSRGDSLLATYVDADDGSGGSAVEQTATALTDCVAPTAFGVQTTQVSSNGAVVLVQASEPVTAVVEYGNQCANLTFAAPGPASLATDLAVPLSALDDQSGYAYRVLLTDVAGNQSIIDNGGGCFAFVTPKAPKGFTEQYFSDFDLEGQSLTLTPNGGADFYVACLEPALQLPADPSGSTLLTLTDDDSLAIALGSGVTVPLYGVDYSSVFVGSNGYLTLGSADSDYDETLEEHFELPRIAALYDDLNPSAGGQVGYKLDAQRLIVTWFAVPQFSTSDSNTFQVEVFFDGRIRLTWLGIDCDDAIVGISAGVGLQPDFVEQDLSASTLCGSEFCQPDIGYGTPGGPLLEVCGGNLSLGNDAELRLSAGPLGGIAVVAVSLQSNPTFFAQFGGTVATVPLLFSVNLPLSSSGSLALGVPGGLGSFSLYTQALTLAGPNIALSNAVRIDMLP